MLILFCLLPAVEMTVSVHSYWHTWVSYPVFKLLMVAIPAIVWWKYRLSLADVGKIIGLKSTNTLSGWILGAAMFAVIMAAYYGYLYPLIDPATVSKRVHSLDFQKHYWILFVYISLFHSFFEEYYWRGFLLSELRKRIGSTLALCLISGALFGLHHLMATLALFSWPLIVGCTLGTAAAGVVWSWMRLRGYSIFDLYVSHILADLAIMLIGYDLMTRA